MCAEKKTEEKKEKKGKRGVGVGGNIKH